MKTHILVAVAALALAACDHNNDSSKSASRSPERSADNSGKNERDRVLPTLTPTDQGEGEADRGITQQIRKGIVADDGLSMTAKNVKIITIDGVVTLRGPVKSEQERTTVASLAAGVAGVKRVDNQLEIAAN